MPGPEEAVTQLTNAEICDVLSRKNNNTTINYRLGSSESRTDGGLENNK